MRLEHWSIVFYGDNPYMPPENAPKALHGNVYGHPNHDDGREVTTSPITRIDDGKVHTSSGSVYELGDVDPDYELEFPNAIERLAQ